MTSNPLVIKLGGSILSRSEDDIFNFAYLSRLRDSLIYNKSQFDRYFIAVGGGFTMRRYRDLARAAGITNHNDLHWVGTTVNVLHAYLIRAFFADEADEDVVKYEDYYSKKTISIGRKVKIGGGGRPGHSGDVDAVLAANKLGTKTVVSLKNVDGVYDKNPKLFEDAKRLVNLKWDKYISEIIGGKEFHDPGANYPIDPVASRMARDTGVRFVVMGGEDLNNFTDFIDGKNYLGTEVS